MKWLIITLPILIYIGASTWANLDLFPDGFMEYWWFDDVMHVLVFGAVGLSLGLITHTYWHKWWIGVSATLMIAAADELTQLFIPARAVTLQDFLMSALGISLVAIGFFLYQKIERGTDSNEHSLG